MVKRKDILTFPNSIPIGPTTMLGVTINSQFLRKNWLSHYQNILNQRDQRMKKMREDISHLGGFQSR